MRRGCRGQGTVELSLGLLLFVTVLLFAVHFGELGHLQLKVDEAVSAALWDTTAEKLHRLPLDFAPARNAIDSAGPKARARYADLDGRASTDGLATRTLALTRARDVQVECQVSAVPAARFALRSLSRVYGNAPGAMTCTASAQLDALRVPGAFAEGAGGLFAAAHARRPTMKLCATGRCSGKYELLLDDWALSGPAESRECALGGCANTAYQASVRALFDAYGKAQGSAGTAVAIEVVGKSPYDENTFQMSFRGEESRFVEWRLPGGEGWRTFPTSPGDTRSVAPLIGRNTPPYDRSYQLRTPCFLGRRC